MTLGYVDDGADYSAPTPDEAMAAVDEGFPDDDWRQAAMGRPPGALSASSTPKTVPR